jgi:hypothetical protein
VCGINFCYVCQIQCPFPDPYLHFRFFIYFNILLIIISTPGVTCPLWFDTDADGIIIIIILITIIIIYYLLFIYYYYYNIVDSLRCKKKKRSGRKGLRRVEK